MFRYIHVHVVTFAVAASIAYSQTNQVCFPDQVQYTLYVEYSGQVPKSNTPFAKQFVDFQNKRILGKSDEESMLLLYNQNVGYMFNKTVCSKGGVGPWVDFRCIPKTAVPSKPYRLGWKPSISVVDYDWWVGSTYVRASVADDSSPLGYMNWINGTSENDISLITVEFADYVPNITDTHTFDVPGICKHASMMHVRHQEELPNIVPKNIVPFKRFVMEQN